MRPKLLNVLHCNVFFCSTYNFKSSKLKTIRSRQSFLLFAIFFSPSIILLTDSWLSVINFEIQLSILHLYATIPTINVHLTASFRNYRSIAEFFTRSLKDDARTIDTNSCLVSPADGTVLHFGLATNEQVEQVSIAAAQVSSKIEPTLTIPLSQLTFDYLQVKGVTYSLKSFLGPANWVNKPSTTYVDNIRVSDDEETSIYQCIIYLAPGDYHRFHSPTTCKMFLFFFDFGCVYNSSSVTGTPTLRRHFSGELLSVSPKIANWLPGLFSLNERALYLGKWQHGFFSFAAVGECVTKPVNSSTTLIIFPTKI